ncbi:hypothetical protein [Spirosoma linguale]|uniref:hypothetical protein n=1 Tax=Spirosoma linguale TaxID=108 RepID=UPI003CC7F09C
MEDQDFFTSFEEMKNSSLPVEPNSARSQERRDSFSDALYFFLDERTRSNALSNNNASVSANALHGVY